MYAIRSYYDLLVTDPDTVLVTAIVGLGSRTDRNILRYQQTDPDNRILLAAPHVHHVGNQSRYDQPVLNRRCLLDLTN